MTPRKADIRSSQQKSEMFHPIIKVTNCLTLKRLTRNTFHMFLLIFHFNSLTILLFCFAVESVYLKNCFVLLFVYLENVLF